MKNILMKLFNVYLKSPVLYDIFLATTLCLLTYKFGLGLKPKENQENSILYLLSVDASLSGFVIAALTILVTVKANTQYKEIEDLKTGIDFLFSSSLYKTLIKVFLVCISEFILIVFALFLINFYYNDTPTPLVNSLFIAALFMSFMTSIRTIGILASVVLLQAQK